MQVIVIINASAGTVAQKDSPWTKENVETTFHQAGLHPEIHYIPPEQIAEALRAAVKKQPDILVVGGGDGTLSTAAGLLAGSPTALGILPLGTLNHFSKDLRIPADLAQAIPLIASQNIQEVDLAEVNGRVFINNCSIGAYPEAVRRREALRSHRGHGKWRAMIIASIDVFKNLRRLRVELTLDGSVKKRRTPLVLVSNNRYSASLFSRSMREQLDAGELWVYTTRHHRFFPLLRLALMAILGRLEEAEGFESWAAKSLTFSTPGASIKAGVDGEVSDFQLPLQLRIRPRALRVLTPPAETT